MTTSRLSIHNLKQIRNLIFGVFTSTPGFSEKCTGAFKFGCRIIFWSIYLSQRCGKSCLISLSIYWIQSKQIFILCFYFIKKLFYKYMQIYTLEEKTGEIFIIVLVLFWMYIMTPVLNTNRRLLLWNINRYTFPNKTVF